MNQAHDLLLDQFPPEPGNDKRLTTWYAQGQSDGFGDRLLMFDNTNAPSWEILRFKPILAREPRFDAALRERVEQLAAFQHDAFPLVRPIKRLGHDDGLAVVSTYSGGASLSEALKKPRSAEFALRLIRQLVPALAALQRVGAGMAHGAVTVDRIILSADGRLMIREHMVGRALDSLEWPAARLWTEFGILVPRSSAAVHIDERTDITQLAVVVLSLLAGRRIGPDDYPDKTIELLDELTLKNHLHNPSNPTKFQALRHWLERALQLSGQSFTSALDAEGALVDLQEPGESRGTQADQTFRPAPKPALPEESAAPMWSAARGLPAPAALTPPAPASPSPPKRLPITTRVAGAFRSRIAAVRSRLAQAWRGVPGPVVRVASVVLAILAIAEAIFIGRLLTTRSAASEYHRTLDAPNGVPLGPVGQAPVACPTLFRCDYGEVRRVYGLTIRRSAKAHERVDRVRHQAGQRGDDDGSPWRQACAGHGQAGAGRDAGHLEPIRAAVHALRGVPGDDEEVDGRRDRVAAADERVFDQGASRR